MRAYGWQHTCADSISKHNLYCSIVIIKATNIFGQTTNQNLKQCSLRYNKNDITSIPKHFWMNRSEFKLWCDCWLAHLTLDKIDQRFVWSHDVSFENAITFSVISVQIVTDNGRRIDVIFWGCCPHNSMRTKQGSGYVSGSSTKILLIDNSIKTPVYS